MIADIRNALTRKFGPAPAWAWLTALAGAVYLWRRRGGGGTTGPSNDTGIPLDDTTAAEPRDPITLQPGETAYDPATGATVSGQPVAPTPPDPAAPIVLGPGEVAYDPATGRVIAGQPTDPADAGPSDSPESPQTSAGGRAAAAAAKPSALQRAKNAVKTGRIGPRNRARLRKAGYTNAQIDFHLRRKTPLAKPDAKQHPKPKAQHHTTKPTVKHPTAGHSRPRSHGATRHPASRPKPTHTPPRAPKPRAHAASASQPAAPRTRPTVSRAPVVRQRPEPSHTKKKKKK
jgi:protein TonB